MPQDDVPQLRHEILLRLQCHSHRELHMPPGADWVGRLVHFGGLGQSDGSDVSLVFLLFCVLTCFDS